MAAESMTYCEGCSARIPNNMEHCPYCGIGKPYSSKYSHKQSTSTPSYARISRTTSASIEESRPSSTRVNSVSATTGYSSQTSSYRRNSIATPTSAEHPENAALLPTLIQAVNEYNTKDFKKARDLTEGNRLLDWRAGLINGFSLLRLIETQETEKKLSHYANEILLTLSKPMRESSLNNKSIDKSIARYAIYRAIIFAINNIGTDLVFNKSSKSGNCVFRNGNYYGYQLLRLRAYVDVLQGLNELSFSQNLSSTILLLSTLIIRLESGCRTGLSTTRLKALRLSHKQKCRNPLFVKALEASNHVVKMSFVTKTMEISSEAPINKLGAGRIEYSIG